MHFNKQGIVAEDEFSVNRAVWTENWVDSFSVNRAVWTENWVDSFSVNRAVWTEKTRSVWTERCELSRLVQCEPSGVNWELSNLLNSRVYLDAPVAELITSIHLIDKKQYITSLINVFIIISVLSYFSLVCSSSVSTRLLNKLHLCWYLFNFLLILQVFCIVQVCNYFSC